MVPDPAWSRFALAAHCLRFVRARRALRLALRASRASCVSRFVRLALRASRASRFALRVLFVRFARFAFGIVALAGVCFFWLLFSLSLIFVVDWKCRVSFC
jgi:hypothetical protein